MSLNDVADKIVSRVQTAYPAMHTRATEGGAHLSPQFFIVTPSFDYHTTARKKDYELEAWLLLGNTLSDQMLRALRDYTEPAGIKAAIEGNDTSLGGLVDDCRVLRFRWLGAEEYQMVEMLGGIFTIQIMGSTS